MSTIKLNLQNLSEINSLLKSERLFIGKINEEQQRILTLDKKKRESEEKIQVIHAQIKELGIKDLEYEYQKLADQLLKNKQNLDYVSNDKEAKALETTIQNITNEMSQFENKILEAIEREEKLNTDLKDTEQFLAGLKETRIEIEKEVNEANTINQSTLQNVKNRIESLLSLCDKNTLLHFDQALKKHPLNPLSFINGLSCNECKMSLNSTLKSAIENAQTIETCPYCERVMLPTTLNY